MKAILLNLANHMLIEFCLENKIDCSGTVVSKKGRGFTYVLTEHVTGEEVAQIFFHKMSVPTFTYNPGFRKLAKAA